MIVPKALCGDSYFEPEEFQKYYHYKNIKFIPLGPHTPWPNRAEAAVKLFSLNMRILVDSLQELEKEMPFLKDVSVSEMAKKAAWARNHQVTYGGKTPLEIAYGRRPPDLLDVENMLPIQLVTDPTKQEKTQEVLLSLIHI